MSPKDEAGHKAAGSMFETNSTGGAGRVGSRERLWAFYLLPAVVGALVCGLVLDGSVRSVAYLALAVLGAGAVAAGVYLERPGSTIPWYVLLAGLAILLFGDTARHGVVPGLGSASGGISLVAHVALLTALGFVIYRHARTLESGALLDASMLAVGGALVVWVCLLGPFLYEGPPSLAWRPISAVDALYAAGFAWLVFASARRSLPLLLAGSGFVALIVGDVLYATSGVGPADVGWLLAYALLGAAALHPDMRDLAEPAPGTSTGFGMRGVAVVSAGILVVPVVLAVQYLRDGPVYPPVVAAGSVALFALALARLRGLANPAVPKLSTSESGLDASEEALVGATDRKAVYEATLRSVKALLERSGRQGTVGLALGGADELDVVAATDQITTEGDRLRLRSGVVRTLVRQRGVSVRQETHPWLVRTTGKRTDEYFFAPIPVDGKLGGVILAGTGASVGAEVRRGIEALGGRVAVALERIERTEEGLRRRARERFESLTRNATDIVMVLDGDGTVQYVSPAYERVLGHDPKDAVGGDGLTHAHPDDAPTARRHLREALKTSGSAPAFAMRVQHADGSWHHVEVEVSNLLDDPNVGGVVLNARDVTERKQTAAKLTRQALYDPLTGLPNRDLLMDRLGQALTRPGSTAGSVAVIFLNLDRFKLVNDSLGREAGDRLLVAVGKRLTASLRPEDTVARLGGDEFVILMEDVESVSQVIYSAERVVKLFEAPFMSGGQEAYTTISAGIAMSRSAADQPLDLLRDADMAMHRAKAQGKSRYEVFDAAMGSYAHRRLERDTELRRAIEREEFVVYYQPKMDLTTGHLHGFEALVRWEHPERGLVPPFEFIPLAEESGLIVRIGHWVLEESCRRAKAWQERYGGVGPAIGVNLSARQFRNPRLPELVAAVLEETRLSPEVLLLEVTESAMMEDAEASSATLTDLKDLGVRVAIDDFGTGYSSLAYLKTFPLDMLKIDRSFVNELGQDRKSTAIVEAVCALGNTLQMQVLAEGIETAQQATQLQGLGCELGQGYFFARPLTQRDAEDMISRHA
jgi:diguanylate cyclase (GGDEF)-like protein/PAS domain S-box-containing protein